MILPKRLFLFSFLILFLWGLPEAKAANSAGLIARGLVKTVSSAFAIPGAILRDSTQVMFPFGIVSGAVRGSFNTVAGTLGGLFDVARGSAPYAKYGLLFI